MLVVDRCVNPKIWNTPLATPTHLSPARYGRHEHGQSESNSILVREDLAGRSWRAKAATLPLRPGGGGDGGLQSAARRESCRA